MNSCAEVRDSIGASLDGELTGARADAVRSHVMVCPACAEEQRHLIKLDSAVRALLESESAALEERPVWHDLRQRLEAKSPWYAGLSEWASPMFRAPAFAWAVPVAILMLLGTLYLNLFAQIWSSGSPRNTFAAVESIDAFGRNVALLREHESKTTVIWLYQNPESENEASGEVSDKGPAF